MALFLLERLQKVYRFNPKFKNKDYNQLEIQSSIDLLSNGATITIRKGENRNEKDKRTKSDSTSGEKYL